MMQGEKTILVPFEKWNAADIRKWHADPYYKFYFRNIPECLNIAQLEDFPRLMGMNMLMIYDRGQWEASFTNNFQAIPVGMVSWDNVRYLARTCEFGVIVDKDSTGKHYGKESMGLFLNHLFNRLGFHKVSCNTASEASDTNAKTVGALGFKFESIIRDNFFMDGKWHDEKRFSMLDTEFRKVG